MNLKNYTSTVDADKSISRIERLLVDVGAKNINKQYAEDKTLKSITFLIDINGQTIAFRVEAKIDLVFKILWAEVKRPQPTTKARVTDQAERTAWKIVQDWVESQITMVQLQQAELAQVFLPYAYDPVKDQTFYQSIKGANFKALMA